MKRLATALTVLVLTAGIAPSAVAGSIASTTTEQASAQTYAGAHVSFGATDRAVTDYAVHGETVLDSVKVQSTESVESGGLVDLGASLSAVTRIEGAGLRLGATTRTEARVKAGNGATVAAHDNRRGILVVASGNQSDYVVADLSTGANASAETDSQVEVTTENGTEGTFVVVGEGNVTVNDEGDVTARLGDDGRLVFRAYPDGKDDADETQEDLIAEGEAAAEVYVMAANRSASGGDADATTSGDAENATANASGRVVVDAVSYGRNTTVETKSTTEGTVTLAVNRTTHEGTVLLTSVSEKVLNASEGLSVTVNGTAAVEAATYSQLKSAIGSDQSRYLVRGAGGGSAEANASTDVLVAVNHFSERTVSLQSETADEGATGGTTTDESGDATTDDGSSDDATTGDGATTNADPETGDSGSIPGFTATAAIVALVAAALLARVR